MSDKLRKEIAKRQDAKAKALTPAEPPKPAEPKKEPSGAEG